MYSNKIYKTKVHKMEIAKQLYFLNHYILGLKKQRNKCVDGLSRDNLSDEISELYALKNNVLVKMILNGNANIRHIQANKKAKTSYYIVRINRDYTFHMPNTNEIKKVLSEENTKKISGEFRSE